LYFHIKSLYSFLMQELLALYSSGAMNAAAPDGRPRGGLVTKKDSPARRATERP